MSVRSAHRERPAVGASVAGSLAGKAAEMVTLVLLATVVPRVLGPADYGRFSVPLTVVTLGSLALTLGGPTLMARFVPAAPPDERMAVARAIGARLARGRAAQVAVIAAVALAAVVWDPDRVPLPETALVVAALALNVATTLALQVTLGLGRTGAWSVRYPLQNAVLIAGVLVLHPVAGATGTVVAILLSAVAGVALAAAVAGPVIVTRTSRVPVPPGAVRFGALQAAGAALVQVSHRGGVLVVALLAGSADETGFAALAVGIALGVTYAVLQAFTVTLPHLAGAAGGAGAAGADAAAGAGATATVTTGAPPAAIARAIGPHAEPAGTNGAASVTAAIARAIGPHAEPAGTNGAAGAGTAVTTGATAKPSIDATGVTGAPAEPAGADGTTGAAGAAAVTAAEAVLRRLAWGLLGALAAGTAVVAVLLPTVVPAVFGSDYEDAVTAFGPALALVVLAPINSLAVQVAALRLRPEAALAGGIAAAVAFAVTAVAAVPAWGAAGGTAAALAGATAGAVVSVRMLPGAAGRSLAAASFAGAGVVLAVGLVT